LRLDLDTVFAVDDEVTHVESYMHLNIPRVYWLNHYSKALPAGLRKMSQSQVFEIKNLSEIAVNEVKIERGE